MTNFGRIPAKRIPARPAGRPVSLRLANGNGARDAARANGISDKTFDSRLRYGWTPDQASGEAAPPDGPRHGPRKRRLLPDGRSARQVALSNGVTDGEFVYRCRAGWTLEQASGLEPRPSAKG